MYNKMDENEVTEVRIAICDDDEQLREQLAERLREYAEKRTGHNVTVSVFSYAAKLLEAAQKTGGFDIYILDIIMPGINGISLGIQLREEGFFGKIIYLTSSEEYALESYRVKAFDYLLKPVKKEMLFSVLDEAAMDIESKPEKSLLVKTKESSIRLNYSSILYAELNRRSVVYHLTNGKEVESLTIRSTFSEAVQPLLQDSRFVQSGASMAVNMEHITAIEHDALVFKDVYKVYWSVKACRELRSVWYNFWFNGEENK